MNALAPKTSALLGLLLLVPPAAASQEWREGESRTQANAHIQGRVIDQATGDGIAEVGVLLRSFDGSGVTTFVTDSRGTFIFSPMVAGIYELELIRFGYATLRETVMVEPASEVWVTVEMAVEALALEGIVATSTRRSRLESNGFYQRRQRRPGTFFTREDIEIRNPTYLSDVLRWAPLLRTEAMPGGRGQVILGRGGCRPSYYLDGISLSGAGTIEHDIHPADLEGIEVYSRLSAPVEYQGSSCGSIVMWTRQPGPGEPRGRLWLRTGFGTLFVVGSFLLTR